MPPNRMIRAADTRSLPVAQHVVNTVRDAYMAQPGAMLISGLTLNPLEVLAVHGDTGQSYRVPVVAGADGALTFGTPVRSLPGDASSLPVAASGQAGTRGISDRAFQRIQAAIDRGALPPHRAAFWAALASAGEDISQIDQLVGGLLPSAGTMTAAASRGGARPEPEKGGLDEYHALFGTREDGERAADACEITARATVAALTDDEVFDAMFGKVSTASAPVTASAARPAGQHAQGGAVGKRWRVHVPQVTVRVPRDPNVAAGADPGSTSWKLIELYGGDLVPENAHPEDVARLRQERAANGRGPKLKDW
jgi:hypothetical protein